MKLQRSKSTIGKLLRHQAAINQGISKLCYYRSLRDLRAAHNEWRIQANADNAAKHAQNLAEWQLRCEGLPPGAQKPKGPV